MSDFADVRARVKAFVEAQGITAASALTGVAEGILEGIVDGETYPASVWRQTFHALQLGERLASGVSNLNATITNTTAGVVVNLPGVVVDLPPPPSLGGISERELRRRARRGGR